MFSTDGIPLVSQEYSIHAAFIALTVYRQSNKEIAKRGFASNDPFTAVGCISQHKTREILKTISHAPQKTYGGCSSFRPLSGSLQNSDCCTTHNVSLDLNHVVRTWTCTCGIEIVMDISTTRCNAFTRLSDSTRKLRPRKQVRCKISYSVIMCRTVIPVAQSGPISRMIDTVNKGYVFRLFA